MSTSLKASKVFITYANFLATLSGIAVITNKFESSDFSRTCMTNGALAASVGLVFYIYDAFQK